MKKGFTLIELLAIVILLGIILVLVYPNIVNLFEKKTNEISETKLTAIFSAAENYIDANSDIYPKKKVGATYCIKIEDLYKENLVPFDVDDYLEQYVEVKVGKKTFTKNLSKECDEKSDILTTPTYNVSPSGYTNGNKKVKINYPIGYTNEYSLDGGTTWQTYTSALIFTDNGSVIARATDGTNYATASPQLVTGIDKTAPTLSASISSITSKQINVVALCSDTESGITKIEYSKDDGKNWINNNTKETYSFTNLTSGTYNIKVRCTNGAGETTSEALNETTTNITIPTYNVSPSGYTTGNKIVTITYPEGYTNEYSTDGGITWKKYTKEIIFTDNGSVIARVSDGLNYVAGSSQSVTGIDKTAPTANTSISSTTSKQINVVALCSDTDSGITKIEYSKNNGTTFVSNGTTSTYSFTNLASGTYNIKVRCTNGAGTTTTSDAVSQETVSIEAPTYSVSPSGYTAGNKTVTITYPEGYTNEYSFDGGVTWKTNTSVVTLITFEDNGSVIARVTDGTNYVTASSQAVTGIDKTSPIVTTSASNTNGQINVTALCSDTESGITKIEFSNDNGASWIDNNTTATYSFTNLINEIKVRCTNGALSTTTVTALYQGTPVYHKHTGSTSSGGGCYTAANMVQVPHQNVVPIGSHLEGHRYQGNESYYNYCEICGVFWDHHPEPRTVIDYGVVTSYTTEQRGWKLNCGKTEGVDIDGYSCPNGGTVSGNLCIN